MGSLGGKPISHFDWGSACCSSCCFLSFVFEDEHDQAKMLGKMGLGGTQSIELERSKTYHKSVNLNMHLFLF